MNLKLKKLEIPLALDNMMNDDIGIDFELTLFTFNIKWKFVVFWIHSFHSQRHMKKQKHII
jgi:hypothetical protein